jgi:3-methyl-2-oxobutanoate hydroxymethyltransferase
MVTIKQLQGLKDKQEKIAMLTAYDASFAALAHAAGVDVLLVGDSLGMVVQGQQTTLPVSVRDIVYHCSLVRRGAPDAYIIADMPYMSVFSKEQALKNAARCMQKGYANMVKIEGGMSVVPIVEVLVQNQVPVCGHLGLQPQSVIMQGGYNVQGREQAQADSIMKDALALQKAGIQMLVLECVPAHLAQAVSEKLAIPVIGIGAGVDCDGQVLVCYDMLGITIGKRPKFSHNFLEGADSVAEAMAHYVQSVKARHFPTAEHSFS